ncbi:MAG: hypothetical protein M3Z15_08070 [Pseudomonadota bacterium]|nr:hypothetical protein [Pseudomonadota bacterium]
MRHRRLLTLALLALFLPGCKKAEPVSAVQARPVVPTKMAMPAPPRERGEYTNMPGGTQTYTTTTAQAIAAEAQRGGPRGEPRVFENPEEQNELARGSSPKFMNGQFRYYLASVAMVQPQGECKQPLLAVNLAIENLHGTPTAAIYGEFTFTRVVGGDGSALTETVAVPYHADIPGPFSNKQGGVVYATAYLAQADPVRDSERWTQIAAINPQRLKVWFKPEAFYYADRTQYAQRTGKMAAQRDAMTCGGTEGSRAILK